MQFSLLVCHSFSRSAVQRQVLAVPLLDGRRKRGVRRADGCRGGPGADGAERCSRLSGAKGARRDDASHSEEAVSYFDSESRCSIVYFVMVSEHTRGPPTTWRPFTRSCYTSRLCPICPTQSSENWRLSSSSSRTKKRELSVSVWFAHLTLRPILANIYFSVLVKMRHKSFNLFSPSIEC